MAEDPPKPLSRMGAKALSKHALDQVTDGERDNEKLLRKLNSRMERVGLTFPGVEVRWDHLVVEAVPPKRPLKAVAAAAAASQKLEPSAAAAAAGKNPNSKRPVILDAGSGVLPPGRMCLLLGPPGAGRTTLLRALSGQLVPPSAYKSSKEGAKNGQLVAEDGGLRVRGMVSYNGLPTHGSHFQAGMYDLLAEREAAAGITPDDADLEAMVQLARGPHADLLIVEIFARMLGIDHVMDTAVGNEMLKGISGGQKRRVTCGEMAVGLSHVLMLDEITNGLDASSALAIVKALRNMCEYANTTIVVTLLQPSPEVVACFHDVMLMSAGRIAFHGPTHHLLPFFASLGLAPLRQQTLADFAQEVLASPADQLRYRVTAPGSTGAVAAWATRRKWLSPKRAFDASETGAQLAARLAAPPYSHSLQDIVLPTAKYGSTAGAMWAAVLRREAVLALRNPQFFVAGIMQVVLTAFLLSTAFVRMSKSDFNDANLFMSAVFFSLMTMFFAGFNHAPIYCGRLPVFYKQRNSRFLTPASYAVSSVLLRMPELLVQVVAFSIMVYFSIGFTEDAGRFFLFFLNLLLAGINSVTSFQMIGAISRNDVITQGLGACVLMVNVLVSGFPIARTSIPGWWIWGYWISPMAWSLRAMLVPELTSADWAGAGEEALRARGFHTEWKWVWAGIAYLAGQSLLQLAAQVVALTVLGPVRGSRGSAGHEHHEDDDPARPSVDFPHILLHGSSPAHAAANAPTGADGPGSHLAISLPPTLVAAAPATGADSGSAAPPVGSASVPTAGAELAFVPVVFAFKDVRYSVPHPTEAGKQLQLLNGVSGVFRPGVLTSLMGASGAGKTTLMDVLAGRKTGGKASGLQLVNGQPKRMAAFARSMGYVEQLDVHNPYATVEEALLFSARLRVPSDVLPRPALASFVRRMMDVVELGPLAGATIGAGGPAGGLSTEARKRLTIAVELVANPSIVFMDEPTSGLDARAAAVVMRAVRNTVETGRTVVCTLHQPNRDIMDYFDELLLLKPGGRTIFFGPLGPRQERLIGCLSRLPGATEYEAHMNPANWMLEVTAPDTEAALGVDFAELWAASPEARAANELVEQYTGTASAAAAASGGGSGNGSIDDGQIVLTPTAGAFDVEAGRPENAAGKAAPLSPSSEAVASAAASPRFAQPPAVQLLALTHRALVSQWRNSGYNLLRFAVTIGLAWVLGSLYWGRGDNRSSVLAIMDIMGVLFAASLFLPLTNMLIVMPVVAADRAVYYRERASGMYRGVVFAAAQALSELPFLFVQSVLYVIIVYTTVHFEYSATKAMWFWLYMFLDLLFFTFLGVGAMNVAPNMPAATAASSLFILTWNLFCGFLIARKDIKPWYLWAYYFNPPTYIIYGCAVSQMGDLVTETIAVGSSTTSVSQYIHDAFSYSYDFRGWIVLIVLGFIVFARALSHLGLTRLNFQKR
ncbi:hypothetical protein GPECTOR_18g126 [Gonium pectorale]|uniref:ABC transporter domain-containing protein n=1 Tax=Gonium pectorale TaxID=33097 RepID=A0A150GJH7_GONPE|nr:hypothetical protein GPECTOR_18g126 [Gonium pectorale]|eukprot:KXZ49969.1 hypothetical protein GPECTOR_18g126 [Gonium pectorale]